MANPRPIPAKSLPPYSVDILLDDLSPSPDDLDPQLGGADPNAGPAAPSRPLLHMLSGINTGAESTLQGERTLVGNLESECDIVIDVNSPERHVCLVRTSTDGWTVLSVAGDLWVGETYLAIQHTVEITSGVVITLGRVAFCIADPRSIDWSAVSAPTQLNRPEVDGDVPTLALMPTKRANQDKWHAVRLAAGLGIGALVLASAATYLQVAWTKRPMTPDERAAKLKSEQAMVKALPYGKELTLQTVPEAPNRVLVQGWLPQSSQIATLNSQLKESSIDADVRVTAVDDVGKELTKRFDLPETDHVTYRDAGRFTIRSESARLDAHDRRARQTLQELPALQGLDLTVTDVIDDQGGPIAVRYSRSSEHPSELQVQNLDVIRQRQRFVVSEVRLGPYASIVLDNGTRYFEGAKLPDGTVIKHISATDVLVQQGQGERRLALPQALQSNATPVKGSKSGSKNPRKDQLKPAPQ